MKYIPVRKFAANDEIASAEGFSIRKIQALINGKDFVQELHRHDFFFLLALERGKGRHEIDFIPFKVKNHSVFFLRPGQVHHLTLKAGCAGYLLSFRTDFISSLDRSIGQLVRKASNKNSCELPASQFKKILLVLGSIFHEYTERKESYQEMIKANLQLLFIELIRQGRNHESNLKKRNSYQQDRLEEFLQLIETHNRSCKQVQQYADMLHLSAFQLNSITKSTLGKTSSEIIEEHLVLESKRYLLATPLQINQIADELGYADASYFIRFFKKHTGHSPEAFRNNFR